MIIPLEVRSIWGTERLCIIDDDLDRAIKKLTRRKSLLRSDIDALTQLGHTFTGL